MQFETKQGQLLYQIHNLYKNNKVNEHERGLLKDMVVNANPQILQIEKDYEMSLQRLIRRQRPKINVSISNSFKSF